AKGWTATTRRSAGSWSTRCAPARRSRPPGTSRPTPSWSSGWGDTGAAATAPRATSWSGWCSPGPSRPRRRNATPGSARRAAGPTRRGWAAPSSWAPSHATARRRPIFGATVTADDARERFGYGLSERVSSLPLGAWQRDESPQDLLLVRLSGVGVGRATVNGLRPRLAADCALAPRDQTVARAAQAIADLYRYEERPCPC